MSGAGLIRRWKTFGWPLMTLTVSEHSMLQRVAQVLAGSDPNAWPLYIDKARAIILAMRGPTSSMIEAAHPGIPFCDDLADDWDTMLTHAANDLRVVMPAPGSV
jgi:hypothetical protein